MGPDEVIDAAMERIRTIGGAHVLDIGYQIVVKGVLRYPGCYYGHVLIGPLPEKGAGPALSVEREARGPGS